MQRLLNRFQIKSKIGTGGVSSVYQAFDELMKKDLALKILHPHLANNAVIRKRFKQEIEIVRQLNHPHIIRFYELFETDSILFLTMEYLVHGDLKSYILAKAPLPVSEVIKIGLEGLEALKTAHARGILHCDIKPHNFLFDADYHIRLTDFGIARLTQQQDLKNKKNAGTPGYAAPEVLEGGLPDARSDYYSFGITLFEMLCGRLPFSANSPQEILYKQTHLEPPQVKSFIKDCPVALNAIIVKAMARNPLERFQTAEDFKICLDELKIPVHINTPDNHPCPICNQQVSDAFPTCLNCGTDTVLLQTAKKPKDRYQVAITGPGNPGERLDPELRHKLVNLMQPTGAELSKLKKSIPRLPFILIKNITSASAQSLVTMLNHLGLNAEISGKESKATRKKLFHLFNKKILAIYPRILLIGTGSMGGIWYILGKAPVLIPILLVALLVGIPLIQFITYKFPRIAKKKNDKNLNLTPLLVNFKKLRTGYIKGIIRSIAGKMVLLSGNLNTENDFTPDTIQESFRQAVDELNELVVYIISLETEINRIDKQNIADRYNRLSQNPNRTRNSEQDREISQLEELLSIRRKLEHTLQLYIDRLLQYSVSLDKLSLSLAGSKISQTGTVIQELKSAAENLMIEADANKEVEKLMAILPEVS